MGASRWGYYARYAGDIATTLTALQAELFAGSEWEEHCDSLAELWQDEEFMGTIGTHSILDIYQLVEPGARQAGGRYYNNMRPLTEDELMAAFECPRPTLATFQEAKEAGRLPYDGRWNGCCAVIYRGGVPDQVAFWGSSGD